MTIDSITFGIMTNEQKPNTNLNSLINSIIKQNIPRYEILIAHSPVKINIVKNKRIKYFKVNDVILKGKNAQSFTKSSKKTCLIKNAKCRYIILLKEYHILDDNWYSEIKNLNASNIYLFKTVLPSENRFFDLCISNKGMEFLNSEKTLIPFKNYPPAILEKLEVYVGGACFLARRNLFDKMIKTNKLNHLLKDTYICNQIFNNINYNLQLSNAKIVVRKQNLTQKNQTRNELIENFDEIIRKIFPTLV